MKSAELRKLIGKPVTWLDTFCTKYGFIEREGVLLEVKGRNALIDQNGSNDWKLIPNMRHLKEKTPNAVLTRGAEDDTTERGA